MSFSAGGCLLRSFLLCDSEAWLGLGLSLLQIKEVFLDGLNLRGLLGGDQFARSVPEEITEVATKRMQ